MTDRDRDRDRGWKWNDERATRECPDFAWQILTELIFYVENIGRKQDLIDWHVSGCVLGGCSVTRFGEISPFCLKFQQVFGNILNLFWQKNTIGQSFIVVNSQISQNNLPIWSHWVGAVAVVDDGDGNDDDDSVRTKWANNQSAVMKSFYSFTATSTWYFSAGFLKVFVTSLDYPLKS